MGFIQIGLLTICSISVFGKNTIYPRSLIRDRNTLLDRNPKANTPEWNTFTVKLNHHDPLDERTWTMRYLNNSQFFQEGGPIFIFLGGEWTIDESYLVSGQMYDMAEEHNGYMFYTEHRYYGESFPTENYSTENLKYLTTEMAIEDVAHFIAYQKSLDTFKNSKVVVVGKSYSATMATWLREKYPHLVDIAYSSSAPLIAVVDFYEYLEVVNDAINETSPECLGNIQEGFELMQELISTEAGASSLLQVFSYCDTSLDLVNDDLEKQNFFGNIIWTFSGLVQYAESTDIEDSCEAINNGEGDGVQKLVAFMEYYYGQYDGYCLGSYADYVEEYSDTTLTDDASRQWTYQTCTEYGFFQTTNSEKQPFGGTLSLEFFFQMCLDLFGEEFTEEILNPAAERMNIVFGALDLDVTKVISTHGTIDPWYRLGILEDINELSPTIVITGASHRQDLITADPSTDSEEMYAAKLRVKEIIAEWLGDSDGSENDSGGSSIVVFSLALMFTLIAISVNL